MTTPAPVTIPLVDPPQGTPLRCIACGRVVQLTASQWTCPHCGEASWTPTSASAPKAVRP